MKLSAGQTSLGWQKLHESFWVCFLLLGWKMRSERKHSLLSFWPHRHNWRQRRFLSRRILGYLYHVWMLRFYNCYTFEFLNVLFRNLIHLLLFSRYLYNYWWSMGRLVCHNWRLIFYTLD
jgi:hypothetical protein